MRPTARWGIMEVAIVGAGNVGQATGWTLANHGCVVRFWDIQPRMEVRLANSLPSAIRGTQAVFVCVPTDHVAGAVDALASLVADQVCVLRSTVTLGTTRMCAAKVSVPWVYDPEFGRENNLRWDAINPWRLVWGTVDGHPNAVVADLYAWCVAPRFWMTWEEAECVKLLANAFLATKISWANEVAALIQKVGGDAHRVLEAVAADTRIGAYGMEPGRPFGGRCLPKDAQLLAACAAQYGIPLRMLQAALAINAAPP